IEVERDVLVLSGERRHEHKEQGEGFYRLERASGAFRRTLHLPEGVEAEGIQASFDKGVLEVRVPKPAERKPRRIEIAVGERPAAIEGTEPQAA
ncbi:MAG TPA: Hsp20/alpha crystallin family protein, partial [Solirubrobacteraceae bacterium]|nr:Hsp20/alpha crystallin family protein [Solirubrobacteraceae bacterium]